MKATLPATFGVTFMQTALAAVAEESPTLKRVKEHTVRFQATESLQGYRLFRVLYKYLQVN